MEWYSTRATQRKKRKAAGITRLRLLRQDLAQGPIRELSSLASARVISISAEFTSATSCGRPATQNWNGSCEIPTPAHNLDFNGRYSWKCTAKSESRYNSSSGTSSATSRDVHPRCP